MFGGLASRYYGDTWTWDGASWTKQSPALSPSPRIYAAMAYDEAHGQVVLFGGAESTFYGDTWIWDGTNWIRRAV
jgi:hypothetical protein